MSESLAAHLRRLAGDAAIRERTEGGPVVVSPDRAAGVAAVLAFCSDEGVPARAAGGMTWLQPAAPGAAPRVVVSTARLTGTTEYNPGDLVVGTLAGTPLAELEATLAAQGQTLPLDPPSLPGATVGATVALNAAGPLRAGHGTPRDMVLGLELVTGDGRLLRFGGRVVKNVAGYDVVRLVTGSRGLLGVVTSLHLRVRGTPEADTTLLMQPGDEAAAAALALGVRDALNPDSLEVLSPALVAAAGAATTDGTSWGVVARLRGGRAGVAEAESRLQAVAGPLRAVTVGEAGGLWQALARDEASAALHLRITARPAELGVLLRACHAFVTAMARSDKDSGAGSGWRVAAHGTAGVARLWLSAGGRLPAVGVFTSGASALEEIMTSQGWTWRYEVVPGALRAVAPPDARPAARAAELMEQIRRSFDPAGILGSPVFGDPVHATQAEEAG